MIDALFDFVTMIKDFVMSLIDGLGTLLNALFFVVGIVPGAARWMPGFLFSFVSVAVTLIIVLRIIGR